MNKHFLEVWGLLILLAAIWGSSFILMKYGLFDADGNPVFSGDQLAALRLSIAFLSLSPMIFLRFRTEFVRNWKPILATAVFGNTIPAFMFGFAQEQIESSLSGMINSLTPLFTFLIAVIIFKAAFKTTNMVGIIIGLAGSLTLILGNSGDLSFSGQLGASLMIVLATICYAISVNVIKFHLSHISSLRITMYAFFLAGPPCLIYTLLSGVPDVLQNHPNGWVSLSFIAILAVVGTAVALILFNALVKRSTSIGASSVTYLLPPVALLWGYWDGETITSLELASVGIILGGVYLTHRK